MHNGIFQGQIYNIYSWLEALVLYIEPWKQGKSMQTRMALYAFYHHMRGEANGYWWTCPPSIKWVLPRFYLWCKTCDVAYQALSQLVQQWEGPGDNWTAYLHPDVLTVRHICKELFIITCSNTYVTQRYMGNVSTYNYYMFQLTIIICAWTKLLYIKVFFRHI